MRWKKMRIMDRVVELDLKASANLDLGSSHDGGVYLSIRRTQGSPYYLL